MTKKTPPATTPPEAVISIIGAGMTMVGDTDTDGSLRIEGTIRGSVRAGKSVVVGKDGLVDGSVFTQDAVIAGRVSGGIHAESRLELQATSEVSGEIVAPRMQVEEGAKVQGQVAVGESAMKAASRTVKSQKADGGGKAEQQTGPKQLDDEGRAVRAKEAVPGNGGRKASQTEPEGSQEARRVAEGRKTELEERQQQRPRS